MLVDTHCHLDMLDEDTDGVLARAAEAGVGRVITIGVDVETSEWAVRAAGKCDNVFASVGLHPHDARLRSRAGMLRLRELASHPRAVGVGEAGLDYYYDNSPRDQQRRVFAEHVRLAKEVGKALIIHSRDAWDDTFAVLEAEEPPDRLVFHCFSGGPREAERAIAIGAFLSFSGVVTFRNAELLREAAATAPLDRVVVETDSPFLTPHPYRGRRNEPARVVHVVEEIARVKELPLEEVARRTTANAERLFGLS